VPATDYLGFPTLTWRQDSRNSLSSGFIENRWVHREGFGIPRDHASMASVTGPTSIVWPSKFSPERSRVHVRNEIELSVRPDRAWTWLVRAKLWPTWYSNSSRVEIAGGVRDLYAGARFRWRTFGVNLSSTVEEFVPPCRLAWAARGIGVDVYHAWLITPSEHGCHVLTEESQYGLLARLDHALRPMRMSRGHQMWLEALRDRASVDPPP